MKSILSIISIIYFLIMTACDEEQLKPEPIDPCIAIKADTFKIRVFDRPYTWYEYEETDTLLSSIWGETSYNYQRFAAEGGYDIYEWYIGDESEPRIGNDFELDFKGYKGSIFIRLIAKDTILKECFEYKRLDTATKTIYLIDYKDAAILGKYNGIDSENNMELEIKEIQGQHIGNRYELYLYNFPGVCEDFLDRFSKNALIIQITNRKLYLHGDFALGKCPLPRGIGYLQNDTFKIDYQNYDIPNNLYLDKHYEAIKIYI